MSLLKWFQCSERAPTGNMTKAASKSAMANAVRYVNMDDVMCTLNDGLRNTLKMTMLKQTPTQQMIVFM